MLRHAALAARAALPDRDGASSRVAARLRDLPEYAAARTVCWYVGVREEVATAAMIGAALEEGTRCVVPWRAAERLELFEITSLEELATASWGLREPGESVRADPSRQVHPEAVDLFVVPGVAFDRRGGRLGYGRGFYDRLLPAARRDAVFVGLAFEVQMADAIPRAAHDVPMHCVVTDAAVYPANAGGAIG